MLYHIAGRTRPEVDGAGSPARFRLPLDTPVVGGLGSPSVGAADAGGSNPANQNCGGACIPA
jgi:hypothetical protein